MLINMLIITGLALVGLLAGVLVNYFADVLPRTRTLSAPACPVCGQRLPLMKYLLRSRCTGCQAVALRRGWITNLLFTAMPVMLWFNPPERFPMAIALILLVYLGVIFLIDLEHRAILMPTVWVGALLFLALGWQLHGLALTLIGGAAGFGIMLALHYAGHFFSQWLARRRGEVLTEPALGFGDVNFAGVIGLGLGWPGIVAGLLLAILLGGLFSALFLAISLITRRYRMFQAIPYAPFMVLAVVFLLFR